MSLNNCQNSMRVKVKDYVFSQAEGPIIGEDSDFIYLENPTIINNDNSISQWRGIIAIPKAHVVAEAAVVAEAVVVPEAAEEVKAAEEEGVRPEPEGERPRRGRRRT